jgi:MerR family transcriptional regulator, copper efflux regulator
MTSSTDLPVACSLGAEQSRARGERWQRLGERALRSRDRVDGGVRLRFERSAGVIDELRELVALERECCPFLDFRLGSERQEIVLEARGDESAQPVLELFAGLRPDAG